VVGTPDVGEVTARLGSAEPLWRRLIETLETRFGPLTPEWKKYSKDAPWTLRLLQKKRCLVYLSPDHPPRVSVILGDKAVALLPPDLRDRVLTEKRYPEGTPARIALTSGKDIDTVITLVSAKFGIS
jgi:hypothetical protein